MTGPGTARAAALDVTVAADVAALVSAVAADKPLLVTPRTARIAWRIGRLSSAFVASSSIRFVAKQRRLQAKRAARTP